MKSALGGSSNAWPIGVLPIAYGGVADEVRLIAEATRGEGNFWPAPPDAVIR